MPKITINLLPAEFERLRQALKDSESLSSFGSAAIVREIMRREKGGKVHVNERKAGRPKKGRQS